MRQKKVNPGPSSTRVLIVAGGSGAVYPPGHCLGVTERTLKAKEGPRGCRPARKVFAQRSCRELHAVARRPTPARSREAPSQGETLSREPCRHQYAPVLKSGHQSRRKGGQGPGSSREEQAHFLIIQTSPYHQGGKDRRIPPTRERCPNLIHCDVQLAQRFTQHKVFLIQVDQNFQSNVDAVVPWKH